MDDFFQVGIESFPSYKSIYLKFEPTEPSENSSFFEIEIPREELALTKLFRKIRPYQDLDSMEPIKALSFARDCLKRNINTCYCSGQDLSDIVSLYRDRVITPEKEFPGSGEGERSDVYGELYPGADQAFITESIETSRDIMINGKLIERGTTIKFFYEGKLE